MEDSAYYDPPPGFARRDFQAYATPRRVITYASVVRGGLSDGEADRGGSGVNVGAWSKANEEVRFAPSYLPLNPLAPARAQGGPRYATLRQALEPGGSSKGMPALASLSQNLGAPCVLPPATTQVSHSPPYSNQDGTKTGLPPSDGHTAQGWVEGKAGLTARGQGSLLRGMARTGQGRGRSGTKEGVKGARRKEAWRGRSSEEGRRT